MTGTGEVRKFVMWETTAKELAAGADQSAI